MPIRKPYEVVLGGQPYYFMLNRAELVEFRLRDKLEELVDYFSNENVLDFFRSFVRASYKRKTQHGFVSDDEAAIAFLNSENYDKLLRIIFWENPDPEEALAVFIDATAWNLHDNTSIIAHNIFDEENPA